MKTHAQALPVRFLLSVVLAGVLIVPLIAAPAAADHERGRRRIEIRGMVTAIDLHNRTFYVRDRGGRFGGHSWAIVVDRNTDFDIRRRRRDHDGDFDHDRPGPAFRRLAVGDLVEVEGRLIDRGTILAREVDVFRRGGFGQQPPYGQPPYGQPPYGQPPVYGSPPVYTVPAPIISYPTDGSIVSRREFLISGRTISQAHVYIKVAPVFGPVAMGQTFDVETDADYNGFFSAAINPGRLPRPGIQYQITVVAASQGVQSPATTLTVRAN